MRTASVLLFALASAQSAPLPKELRGSDEERIVGTWERTKEFVDGKESTGGLGIKWVFSKDGTAEIIYANGSKTGSIAAWKIDPTAKVKTFDWTLHKTSQFIGVYEIDGDTLRMNLTAKPNERPGEVSPNVTGTHSVFQRRP